jgi:hypothetical protein
MRFSGIILFLIVLCLQFSCRESVKGDLKPDQHPETYTVVDTILRTGDNRYKTQIVINWWGEDPDGYIAGYEYSFDKVKWSYTLVQDSTFIVQLPEGADTFNFTFYVRAVDNDGLKDPSPAHIVYPVKNSPPEVSFVYPTGAIIRKPAKTFPVLKFFWNGTDPDGAENLNSYELVWNDTTRPVITISAGFTSAIFEATSLLGATSDCRVYQGNNMNLHPTLMPGLKLNDTNYLYIRSVDKVGEKSSFCASYPVYVRKPKSTTLLVNAYASSIQTREDFYTTNLTSAGVGSFDVTRLNEVQNGAYTELAPDNITQAMIFDLFKTIIWIGKDATYSLSLAEKTTDGFFTAGGKMFMAIEISSSMDPQAGYLGFSPIDSLVEPPKGSQLMIDRDSLVLPRITGWPVLKSKIYINPARPFYENIYSTPLYDARISRTNPKSIWNGKSTIMTKKVAAGKTIFIISSVELHNLDGNNNIRDLFIKLFKDELGL